jgi:hypothetical protein
MAADSYSRAPRMAGSKSIRLVSRYRSGSTSSRWRTTSVCSKTGSSSDNLIVAGCVALGFQGELDRDRVGVRAPHV